jgi:peptidoglycan/LPS O-acetylase OafA/YrhL
MKGRIEALEGLRGWAALLIVFYHLPKWHSFLDVPIIVNGHYMVPLFFVLSGFVIHTAYAHRINNVVALLRFQTLRFWRLYPVHLLLLAVYLALECIRWIAVHHFAVSDVRLAPFTQNGGTALVQQIMLIQAIGPTGNAQTFNGPAWSISVEFYTYLIFGLLVLISRRWLTYALVVLMAISVALLVQDTGFESLLTCLVGFSIGTLVSALGKYWHPRIPDWITSIALCVFFGYLALVRDPHLALVFALAAVLVFAVSGSTGGSAMRLLQDPRSLWLGGVSYSLYMCHALVLWLVAIVLKRGGGMSEKIHADGKWVLEMTAIEAGIACALSVAAALIIGWLVMRFVEIPVRDWSRRRAGVSPLLMPTPRDSEHPRYE